MNGIPLLIFAKTPIAGKVKTRLMSNCSAEQAAAIAMILLEESLALATVAWPGKVILSTWPSTADPIMQSIAKKFAVDLVLQGPGDLGEKMAQAFNHYGYPAAILGSDAAMIEPDSLKTAHGLIKQGQNVVGPSQDGGYYLIGLSQPNEQLFEAMPWGSDAVLELTLERQVEGQLLRHLPASYDIDTWGDVRRARASLPCLDTFLKNNKLD